MMAVASITITVIGQIVSTMTLVMQVARITIIIIIIITHHSSLITIITIIIIITITIIIISSSILAITITIRRNMLIIFITMLTKITARFESGSRSVEALMPSLLGKALKVIMMMSVFGRVVDLGQANVEH